MLLKNHLTHTFNLSTHYAEAGSSTSRPVWSRQLFPGRHSKILSQNKEKNHWSEIILLILPVCKTSHLIMLTKTDIKKHGTTPPLSESLSEWRQNYNKKMEIL